MEWRQVRDWPAWAGVIGGPLAWAVHLSVGYILVTLPCILDVGSTLPLLYVLTAATGAVALASTGLALISARQSSAKFHGDLGESGGRVGFMAASGIMLSGISFLVIVVESFALPFLSFCG